MNKENKLPFNVSYSTEKLQLQKNWYRIKLLWIGYKKNINNPDCYLSRLSLDLVHKIEFMASDPIVLNEIYRKNSSLFLFSTKLKSIGLIKQCVNEFNGTMKMSKKIKLVKLFNQLIHIDPKYLKNYFDYNTINMLTEFLVKLKQLLSNREFLEYQNIIVRFIDDIYDTFSYYNRKGCCGYQNLTRLKKVYTYNQDSCQFVTKLLHKISNRFNLETIISICNSGIIETICNNLFDNDETTLLMTTEILYNFLVKNTKVFIKTNGKFKINVIQKKIMTQIGSIGFSNVCYTLIQFHYVYINNNKQKTKITKLSYIVSKNSYL